MPGDPGSQAETLLTAQRIEYLLTQVARGDHPQRDRGLDQSVQHLLTAQYQHQLLAGGPLPEMQQTEATFFSQNGEDGVLLYLFAVLGHGDRLAAEICAGDGIECCSANLVVNHAWHALLVDGDPANLDRGRAFYAQSRQQWYDPPVLQQAWVTAENVAEILSHAGFGDPLDLLVVDLDGMDYWVWKALGHLRPRVVVTEVNPGLGDERVTLTYDPEFVRPAQVPFASTSLPAMVALGEELGYRFVGTERFGINAFFVREDLAVDHLPGVTPSEALLVPSVRRSAARLSAALEPHRAALRWTVNPPVA
ncbi:MAG: hypothetical protein QOD98_2868 [Nocardioidaceae bacterium]|nr:hypothetical protein [Nocardioidaceae bacterium]